MQLIDFCISVIMETDPFLEVAPGWLEVYAALSTLQGHGSQMPL